MGSPKIKSTRLKIILLGDAAAGKTKLMQRFLMDDFNPRRLSTHAVNIFPYSVTIDEQLWEVDFWDTAGQERFDKLHGSYYFGADACILVFDVTRKITYKNLERWYRELREHCPFIPVICIANKIDTDLAVTNRHFTFAANNDIPIYFASASTGVNVVRAFNDSIKLAIEHKLDPKDEAMEQLISLVSSRHTLTKTS